MIDAALSALAWAAVAAGGILALLSLILAVSLWVMMGAPARAGSAAPEVGSGGEPPELA